MARKILRLPAVQAKVPYSTSTIYELMAEGKFPKPIPLGARAVGWIEEEIDRYIEERIAERDQCSNKAQVELRGGGNRGGRSGSIDQRDRVSKAREVA